MTGFRAVPRCAAGRLPVDVAVVPLQPAEGERGAVVEAAAQAVPLPPRRRQQPGPVAKMKICLSQYHLQKATSILFEYFSENECLFMKEQR